MKRSFAAMTGGAGISSRRRNYMLNPHRRDGLIEFIKGLLHHSFVLDAMPQTADATWAHIENLIDDHRRDTSSDAADVPPACLSPTPASGEPTLAERSLSMQAPAHKLTEVAPGISAFHTRLPLRRAWAIYDAKYHVSSRRHVQPSFNEIRHILNLAQVLEMAETQLRLVTFDGDCTLYSDGKDFSNPKLARYIALLLKKGVAVALVTAAGYAHDADKYSKRLSGLLDAFRENQLSPDAAARFYVLGGECNYLLGLRAAPAEGGGYEYALASMEERWRSVWDPPAAACAELLDVAEASLAETMKELELRVRVIRKARACGVVCGGSEGKARYPDGAGSTYIPRESLDELVLRLQSALRAYQSTAPGPHLPFCAFNGGNDVFCDIGNKAVGVDGLRRLLGLPPASVLHVGDQFLDTGNDYAARVVVPCVWIINEKETVQVLKHVLRDALELPEAEMKEAAVWGSPELKGVAVPQ